MEKLKKVINIYLSDDATLFRYSLSFCLLLSLLPALVIIFYFFNEIAIDPTVLVNALYDFIPQELLSPFIQFVSDKNYHSIMSIIITLIVATYVASKSFYSFMIISMQDENFIIPLILVRLKAFVSFALFMIAICAISIMNQYILALNSLFFILSLIAIFYLFYRVLSFEKKPLSYGLLGSVFSSVAIVGVGRLFLWFVEYFTSYHSLYGPFASLVVLFLSVYLISSIIYFGYCLNRIYGQSYQFHEYKHIAYYEYLSQIINQIYDTFR
ncbi:MULTISPECIES: YhjD/YihY/BrkB family envelope integrity protein [Coprobacillaceae]|uniref:YhjD/YihY/BrkB family envelope integrity protein n=1 Tax=Coprobacillaceae TaxID=2810280 RepID=UPI000E4D1164|nr:MULTISPECIES: YhjD/YihY/BrkB family envelope integrity protein [Coprobacillaceae]RHM60113.1 hypothetical protein DWZ53_07605 [Coprobacillus sp. AF33-1AC]RHS92564.1 hypothetical protein DW911_08105 [Erysipelatoclostridium sp. AM42-17]